MNRMTKPTRPQYEDVADEYARLVAPKYVPIAALVADRVPSVVSAHEVVELAAGTGVLTRLLAPRVLRAGGSFTAVDLSPEMLRNAHRHVDPRVELVVGDVEDLPLPDGSADLVVSSLGPVQDSDRAWSEVTRVLRPGGRVVLVTWGTEYGERTLVQAVRGRLGLDPLPAMAPEEYVTRARRAGLVDVGLDRAALPAVHDSVDAYLSYRAAFGRPQWIGDRSLDDVRDAIRAECCRYVDVRGQVVLDWAVLVIDAHLPSGR